MAKLNCNGGNVADGLLRAAGCSSFLFPHSNSSRELRRAAERQAKKAAKRALKAKQ